MALALARNWYNFFVNKRAYPIKFFAAGIAGLKSNLTLMPWSEL